MSGARRLLLALTAVAAACASAPGPRPPAQDVALAPLLGGSDGVRQKDLPVLSDPQTLLAEGAALFRAEHYAEAAELFEQLAGEGPDQPLRGIALFNAGLARERLGDFARARTHYGSALLAEPSGPNARDARFRLAECLERLGDWGPAQDNLLVLLAGPLTVADRLEVFTRLGDVLRQAGMAHEAERHYESALQLLRDYPHDPRLKRHFFAAKAQFELAELERTRFADIPLLMPLARMQRDLDRKARHFLRAQRAYLRVVQHGSVYWGLAAGYRLGDMYEAFSASLLQAEAPADLDADHGALYRAELHAAVRPYLDRALALYEENLKRSQTVSAHNEWVERTAAGIAKLRRWLAEGGAPAVPAPPAAPR